MISSVIAPSQLLIAANCSIDANRAIESSSSSTFERKLVYVVCRGGDRLLVFLFDSHVDLHILTPHCFDPPRREIRDGAEAAPRISFLRSYFTHCLVIPRFFLLGFSLRPYTIITSAALRFFPMSQFYQNKFYVVWYFISRRIVDTIDRLFCGFILFIRLYTVSVGVVTFNGQST